MLDISYGVLFYGGFCTSLNMHHSQQLILYYKQCNAVLQHNICVYYHCYVITRMPTFYLHAITCMPTFYLHVHDFKNENNHKN